MKVFNDDNSINPYPSKLKDLKIIKVIANINDPFIHDKTKETKTFILCVLT